MKFLVEEKGFNEDRIRSGIKKILKARKGSTQGRLDSFFKVMPSPSPPIKRKNEDTKGSKTNKSKPTAKATVKRPK